MTETEILKQIQRDFKGVQKESKAVTLSVNNLTNEITGLKVTVTGVEKTLEKHDARITETREGQLLATSGLGVVDREMKQVHITAQKDRDHINDELKELRGDQTGQTDVPVLPVAAVKTNSAMVWGFLKTLGPWMVAAAILFGVYLGSGGDAKETLQLLQTFNHNLREIGLKVEQIEKSKTEPVRVPVPVSSECYSEEAIP